MIFGFIGVGCMGGPLARNLVRAGKKVLVYARTTASVQRTVSVGESGTAASLADMAACQVIFTCLPLPEHVLAVMGGENGVYASLKPGAIHVELSTIDPATAGQLMRQAEKAGVAYIQCTLGKTPAHAEKAEEPMFLGGDAAAIEKLADIFEIIGIPHHVGSVEAACAVKLISNMIGMANLAVLAEGLRAGQQAGLEPDRLLELLADTGARSFQMDVRGPWIAAGDYATRFGLDLALKDVRLGCAMAQGWGLELPAMQAVLDMFRKASAQGFGQEDCSAVFKSVR